MIKNGQNNGKFPTLLTSAILAFLQLGPAFADEVKAADEADLRAFDRVITEKGDPTGFGALVSEEARQLRDATREARRGFGQRVSSERRRDGEHRNSVLNGGSQPVRDLSPAAAGNGEPRSNRGQGRR